MSTEFNRRQCTKQERLSKVTVLAMLRDTGTGLETYFENMDIDQWEIVSFDSLTRNVCISVDNGLAGVPILNSITLPTLSASTDTFKTAGRGF